MEKYLSISEMASIHNISRQTLIYYDKIDLFKPIYIDDHGFRFYNAFQIPFLREIIFLKSIGIKLNDIKEHIENRNVTSAISLLDYHKEIIEKEIDSLKKKRAFIQQRLQKYSEVEAFQLELYHPMIEEFSERKVVFVPFENRISRQELHLTLMKAWKIMNKYGSIPSEGFGTIIRKQGWEEGSVFKGSGVYVYIPIIDDEIENTIVLPAGKYACMYKYGMPYELKHLEKLMHWIKDNRYKVIGDMVDSCLLDTTFYENEVSVDLCQLQIPVEKGSMPD